MPPLSDRNKMYDNKIVKTITHPHKDRKTDDIEVGLLHNHTDKDKDKEQSQLRAWKRYPCKHTGRLEGKNPIRSKDGCTSDHWNGNSNNSAMQVYDRSEKLYDRSGKIT